MTISQDIIKARDSLNEKNWGKKSYFSTNEHGICMCAHGALQAQVNPLVVKAMAGGATFDTTDAYVASGACAAAAAEAAAETARYAAARAGAAAFDAAEREQERAAATAAAATAMAAATATGFGAAGMAAARAEAATAAATEAFAAATEAFAAATAAAAMAAAGTAAGTAAFAAATAAAAMAALVKEVEVYNGRPRWVKEGTDRGNLDAHYILGMVGLTTSFNDLHASTLGDIKVRMTKAAKLAESLGV